MGYIRDRETENKGDGIKPGRIRAGNPKAYGEVGHMRSYIFPIMLIILDLGAAVVYGISGDVRKAIYWVAAAVLNITVTF